MNTRFGGRQRPHFLIKRWVNLGPDEKVLPAPEPVSGGDSGSAQQLGRFVTEKKAAPAEKEAPTSNKRTTTKRSVTKLDAPPLKTVTEPSTKEALSDEIPF